MSWLELWSFARYHLRLSSEEFFALTPRQFSALVGRYNDEQTNDDYRFGIIASNVVRVACGEKGEKYTPGFFFKRLRTFEEPSSDRMLKLKERFASLYGEMSEEEYLKSKYGG